jgi:hypothetical protein
LDEGIGAFDQDTPSRYGMLGKIAIRAYGIPYSPA